MAGSPPSQRPAQSPATERSRSRRRRKLFLAILLLGLLLAWLVPRALQELTGASELRALDSAERLSPEAKALLDEVYADLGEGVLFDYHTHLAGIGAGSDCWVNPRMRSLWHPLEYVRFLAYLSAAGVEPSEQADEDFVARLEALVDATPRPSKHLLLAFDYHYDEDGTRDLDASHFHVPNEWVLEVVGRRPDRFEAAISVHPYRADATSELQRLADRGARFVKWLPNAMGIDPASERCDAYYETMAELGLVLLSHTGFEQAVELAEDQELGNPLRLRRPLAAGVRVIAAHCASSGENEDLDRAGERRSSFELFLRLMGEPQWEGRLWGEISTVTQFNRYEHALAELLRRTDLHGRLVNGSDWPLPAINMLYRLDLLERGGLAQAERAAALARALPLQPLAVRPGAEATGAGPRERCAIPSLSVSSGG